MSKETTPHKPSLVRRFFSVLGPGLITGAADDDPSGIATYSIAGAQMGTSMLWTAFITWPFSGRPPRCLFCRRRALSVFLAPYVKRISENYVAKQIVFGTIADVERGIELEIACDIARKPDRR